MVLFNRYEYDAKNDLIGKGSYSRVYKAYDKTGNTHVAVKIYNGTTSNDQYVQLPEKKLVTELVHRNLARYLQVREIEKEDALGQQESILVTVMELINGGNLASYHKAGNDPGVLRRLLTGTLEGLSFLHRQGIIHRSIKPSNILVALSPDGPAAKITDFGISRRTEASDNSSSSALITAIPYLAPEQLNPQKFGIGGQVSFNTDFWSLGLAVYELLTGEILFRNTDRETTEQVMHNILMVDVTGKINRLPTPFNELVLQCMVKDAKLRVQSAGELIALLTDKPAVHPDPELSSVPGAEAMKAPEADAPIQVTPPAEEPDSSDETRLLRLPQDNAMPAGRITRPEPIASGQSVTEITATDEPAATENIAPDETVTLPSHHIGILAGMTDDTEKVNPGQPVADTARLQQAPPPSRPAEPDQPYKTAGPVTPAETQNHTSGTIPDSAETGQLNKTRRVPAQAEDKQAVHIKQRKDGAVSLFNRYEYYPVKDLIGKGGFSRVYKAYDTRLSRWVALKIYKTAEFSDRYSPIAEIKRVVNLDHPNICRYFDIEELEKLNPFGENEKIQVCVMELLDSGNVAEYYKQHEDPEIFKKLLQDILNGLSYLHKNGIIHRDIKPANILIKQTIEGPVAKITDFGISKVSDTISNHSSSALIVSIPYMAPEQLNARRYGINEKISYNLDLWSLGVTIYEVLTGKTLFKNSEYDSSEQIMANIMAPELPEKIGELPQPFKNVVAYCIVKNAAERAQKAEALMVLLNSNGPHTQIQQPDNVPPPVITSTGRQESTAGVAERKQPFAPPTGNMSDGAAKGTADSAGEIRHRRNFLVEETAGPEVHKKAEQHISYLKISIGIAAVFLLAILYFYIKTREDEPMPASRAVITDSPHTPEVVVPVKADTITHTPTAPPDISNQGQNHTPPGNDNTGRVTSETSARDRQPHKRADNDPAGNHTNTGIQHNANRYLLKINPCEDCSVLIDGIDYGPLAAAKLLKVYLKAGSHQIQAISSANSNAIYKKTLSVTPEEVVAGTIRTVPVCF